MKTNLAMVFCLCASVATAQNDPSTEQDSFFQNLSAVGEIEFEDTVNASNGTMSGSQRLSIRTNQLFSAFQLIYKDEKDAKEQQESRKISMGDLQFAPIKLPRSLTEINNLKVCAEVRTINGFYEAVARSISLAQAENAQDNAISVKADLSKHIDGNYTEDLMLLRGFVAPDCAAGRSSYYVPMYFESTNRNAPNTLLAVFEIGNARIEASLHTIDELGKPVENTEHKFECKTTKRVDRGYDCTLGLAELELTQATIYEVWLRIKQPHKPKSDLYRSRITLPKLGQNDGN